jgi:hypothetical protein
VVLTAGAVPAVPEVSEADLAALADSAAAVRAAVEPEEVFNMIILKSLLFIVWNVAIGLTIIELVRWILFNRKSRFIFGMHIPLTPGFVIAKRDWVFNKVRAILHDYLDQADKEYYTYGYLAKWEKLVYETILEKTGFVDEWKFMPHSWKEKIKTKLASIAQDIARKILRKVIPSLIEQLQVEHRIDDFDEQISSKVIRQYYNQYVHKYLIYFFMAVNFLVGITNMILYLIIA